MRIFFVDDYPELAAKYPKMKDCIVEGEYPHKEELVRYLETAPITWVSMSDKPFIDVLTGDTVAGVKACGRSDGIYSWTNELAFYVKRHNVKLPDGFVNHILSTLGKD